MTHAEALRRALLAALAVGEQELDDLRTIARAASSTTPEACQRALLAAIGERTREIEAIYD